MSTNILYDNFNAADGTAIIGRTPTSGTGNWTKHGAALYSAGIAEIHNNQYRRVPPIGVFAAYLNQNTYSTNPYREITTKATLLSNDAAFTNTDGILFFGSTTADTYIGVRYDGDEWILHAATNGVGAGTGSPIAIRRYAMPIETGIAYDLTLKLGPYNQQVFVNGERVIELSSSTYESYGYPAIRAAGASGLTVNEGWRFDDFAVNDWTPTRTIPYYDLYTTTGNTPLNSLYGAIRIPSITTTQDKKLLLFAEGRVLGNDDNSAADVLCWKIDPLNLPTIPEPTYITGLPRASGGWTVHNPTSVTLNTGRILLLTSYRPLGLSTVNIPTGLTPGQTTIINLSYSDDNGDTWNGPLDITQSVKNYDVWGHLAAGPGAAIQTTSGRIICPMWFRLPGSAPNVGYGSFAAYTDDPTGLSGWTIGASTPISGVNETGFVELPNNEIMATMRVANYTGKLYYALSNDNCNSWYTSGTKDIDYPGIQTGACKYHNYTIVTHPNNAAIRLNITIRESSDNAVTWNNVFDPPQNFPLGSRLHNGGGSYSVPIGDPYNGGIYTLFERGADSTNYYDKLTLTFTSNEWLDINPIIIPTNVEIPKTDNNINMPERSPISSYSFSGPSNGYYPYKSDIFNIQLGPGYVNSVIKFTPSVTGVTGTFNPTSIELTNSKREGFFTFTPGNSGIHYINIITNSSGLAVSDIRYATSGYTDNRQTVRTINPNYSHINGSTIIVIGNIVYRNDGYQFDTDLADKNLSKKMLGY